MKKFNGYLFDLDGTLVDTAPDIGAALNKVLTNQHLPQADNSLVRHWVGHGARTLITKSLDHFDQTAGELQIDDMLQEFRTYYSEHLAVFSQPYPTVVETLRQLKNSGCALAVVTNKLAEFSQPLLEQLELADYFSLLVAGDTLPVSKPAAEPALYACEHLKVPPEQTLFIGDSAADVGCARAAGCSIVCMRDGYNHGTPADELGADQVITLMSELL